MSAETKVKGSVEVILPTQEVSEKFTKRDIVINTGGDYPQLICVQFVQDQVDELDKFAEGDEVEIGVNIRGRKWISPKGEEKYFNTLQGWRIDLIGKAEPEKKPRKSAKKKVEQDDDLPF